MNIYGWIFMVLSWGFISALMVFCLARVLGKKEESPATLRHA